MYFMVYTLLCAILFFMLIVPLAENKNQQWHYKKIIVQLM